jgi:Acyl-CoA carboxylase epsilon subunit
VSKERTMSETGETTGRQRPLLRVVRGNPDDTDIAALAAVVASLAAANTTAPAGNGSRSRWADRAMSLRAPAHPGPDAWWASGLPR